MDLPAWLSTSLQIGSTFLLVSFLWIFFRAASFQDAMYIVTHLHDGLRAQLTHGAAFKSALSFASRTELSIAVLAIGLMETVHLLQLRGVLPNSLLRAPEAARWAVYFAAVILLSLFGAFDSHAFIYFQF